MAYTLTNLQDDIKSYTEVDSSVFSTSVLNNLIINAENKIYRSVDSDADRYYATSNTVNGVVSTWTGLDATNMPNFTIIDPTKAWQYTSSLTQPGMKSHTVITRTSEITSVTDTVSTFSQ